jgi:UDP-3-O-[3-hydroxymyristoyl] glucosamine N-acyltransferase
VQGISPLAHISESSRLSEDVTIFPFVFVGDEVVIEKGVTLFSGVHVGNHCVIGRGCVLHPNVTLYENVSLGERVILHSSTVIGADGFGYVFDGQTQVKIPQTGTVTIGDDVEIGANSCVDRAGFGATVLERGVKLDNHVHIGHNCRIGENTVMAGQVGLSGSVEVGKNCTFAGHSGVVDHVKIGDQVTVMMKSAVSKDIPSQSVVSGQPAMEHRQWMKIEAAGRRFPEIYREWKSWLKDNRK